MAASRYVPLTNGIIVSVRASHDTLEITQNDEAGAHWNGKFALTLGNLIVVMLPWREKA